MTRRAATLQTMTAPAGALAIASRPPARPEVARLESRMAGTSVAPSYAVAAESA